MEKLVVVTHNPRRRLQLVAGIALVVLMMLRGGPVLPTTGLGWFGHLYFVQPFPAVNPR